MLHPLVYIECGIKSTFLSTSIGTVWILDDTRHTQMSFFCFSVVFKLKFREFPHFCLLMRARSSRFSLFMCEYDEKKWKKIQIIKITTFEMIYKFRKGKSQQWHEPKRQS